MIRNTFATSLNMQANNFGFLRFFLAVSVLYHHIFPLGGFGKEPIANLLGHQEDVGSLAVLGFFIISGFLVVASFLHSKTILSYSLRRFLRIMPAFWVCLIVTAFIFAPIIYFSERHQFQGFITMENGSLQYIKNNSLLFMHQYQIGNLLSKNPFQLIFDGSLWTLILESKAYILLALLGLLGFVNKRKIIFILFLLLLFFFLQDIQIPKIHNQLIHFFIDTSVLKYATYFFSGVIFYLYLDKIPCNKKIFYGIIIATCIAGYFHFLHQILPFTAPYIIFWLAQGLPFQNFTKFGDFSYGIYIYAFPIQQLLTFFKWNGNFLIYTSLSLTITLIFAILSWHFIEKPALRLKTLL